MVASILGGFLGCLYFIIFRRVWLVEDPLPLPGFEANIKLMDIAGETAKEGGMEGAMHSIRLVGISPAIIMAFTFLRDWPLLSTGTSDKDFKRIKDIIKEFSFFEFICIDIANGYSDHFTKFVKSIREK